MRLEHESIEQFKKDILGIVGRHIDLNEYRVFFFGSRVTGRGDDRSDIDIGIEGTRAVPSRAWAEIIDAFEEYPCLYTLDAVDFKRASEKFKQVALEHIEPLTPIF
jgi:predicted nucleotidyltransferase